MRSSGSFAAFTLLAALLFGAQPTHAQPGSAAPSEPASPKLEVPTSMRVEHEELHAALSALTEAGGRTGDAARAVAEVLEPHFAKENAFALPPLGLLVPLSRGEFDPQMTRVLELTDKLEAELSTMRAEHEAIAAALVTLDEAARAENIPEGIAFAEHLLAHAKTEEEITYPTALVIGRYVRSLAEASGR